MYKNAFVEPC